MQDQGWYVDFLEILGEVCLGKRFDAVVCSNNRYLHSLQPECVPNTLRNLRIGVVVSVKGDSKVLKELRAICSHASANLVEGRQREAAWILLGFQHKWRDRADQHGLRYSLGSVPPDVAHDLTAPCGMADQSYVFQIQLVEQRSQVIGIRIHVVAIPRLARTSMAAAVVGNNAIAVLSEEQHLCIPGVCVQRPSMRKNDRRPCAPIFVENRGSIFGFDRIHLSFSLLFSLRSESTRRLRLTGESGYGQSGNA